MLTKSQTCRSVDIALIASTLDSYSSSPNKSLEKYKNVEALPVTFNFLKISTKHGYRLGCFEDFTSLRKNLIRSRRYTIYDNRSGKTPVPNVGPFFCKQRASKHWTKIKTCIVHINIMNIIHLKNWFLNPALSLTRDNRPLPIHGMSAWHISDWNILTKDIKP